MSKGRSVKKTGIRDQGLGASRHGSRKANTAAAGGGPLRKDASLKAGATGDVPGKRERLLPRIGGTREEIQRTLVETMEGILDGRIEPREAYAIGRLCRLQLKLLGFMEQLEQERKSKSQNVEGSRGHKSQKRRQDAGGTKGRLRWVN